MAPTTTDAPLLDFADVLLANKQLAVENIPLKGRKGKFMATVEPSGCGKSTLMPLTTGPMVPSSKKIP